MMHFKLYGVIESVSKRIFIEKRECHGVTLAEKNKFKIKISNPSCKDPVVFIETVLHELCHVWLYIISAFGRRVISDADQEKIINKITAVGLDTLRKELSNDN